MKKAIITLAAAACMMFAAKTASAQMYFGGSIGFTTTIVTAGNTTNNGSSYKFSPEIGYQINDKIAVGGVITIQRGLPYLGSFDMNDLKGFGTAYASMQADQNDMGGNRFNGIRFAPYFRWIFVDTRRFDLFLDATFAYGNLSQQFRDNNNTWQDGQKFHLLEIAARPGFRLKFDGGRFSIVGRLGSLGYQNLRLAGRTDQKISRLGLDMDTNNIMLGFCISL